MGGCSQQISDASIVAIAKFCPKLRRLEVTRCSAISDAALSNLHPECEVERYEDPKRRKTVVMAEPEPVADDPAPKRDGTLARLRHRQFGGNMLGGSMLRRRKPTEKDKADEQVAVFERAKTASEDVAAARAAMVAARVAAAKAEKLRLEQEAEEQAATIAGRSSRASFMGKALPAVHTSSAPPKRQSRRQSWGASKTMSVEL